MEAVFIFGIILYAIIAIVGLAFSIWVWIHIIKFIRKIIKKYLD